MIEADEEAYNNFRKVKPDIVFNIAEGAFGAVSYTHLRAHETVLDLVCRLLLEKKTTKKYIKKQSNNDHIIAAAVVHLVNLRTTIAL